jgi:hypothetical protein
MRGPDTTVRTHTHSDVEEVMRFVPAVSLLLLAACSSLPPQTMPASNDVLTRAEIARSNHHSALDVIEALRPFYLRPRGPVHEPPLVIIDGVRLPAVRDLQLVPAYQVAEIRYLRAVEASLRFGGMPYRNAIVIRTTAMNRELY